MRDIMQQTSHQESPDAVDGYRRRPTPFLFCHHTDRCFKRLVVATLLATLVGLLVTALFIPDALAG